MAFESLGVKRIAEMFRGQSGEGESNDRWRVAKGVFVSFDNFQRVCSALNKRTSFKKEASARLQYTY